MNIELEGDKAYCECYVDVIHRLLDKDSQIVEWCQCRYLDNFERRDGECRILVRGVVLDGMFWMKGDYSEVVTRGLGEIAGTDGGAVSARYPDDGVYNLRELRSMVKERQPLRGTDFWKGLHELKRT